MMRLSAMQLAVLIGGICLSASAADSPQFRGPNRDGIFPETGLMQSWPAEGPPLAWKAEGIGKGYGAAAIAAGTVYVGGMGEDNEGYITALNLDGTQKWKAPYCDETQEFQAPGNRATPTVDGDRVYVQSGLGEVVCLSTTDGATLWKVHAKRKFKGATIQWHVSESLLVDGDKVFVTPGGVGTAIVALNKMTGETMWVTKDLNDPPSYASPTILTLHNKRQLVHLLSLTAVGLDLDTGAIIWKNPAAYEIHGVTPLAKDNIVYYASGYGAGGHALAIAADGTVTEKWTDKELDCQHHGVVLVDGYLYGTSQNKNKLMCLEFESGKLMWADSAIRQGNTIYADGMLYIYEGPRKGTVSLVKPSPEKYDVISTFAIPKGFDKHWAHPAIAEGKLFIRHGETLYAYDIKAK